MKLFEIFRFELGYQVRRPTPWLIFAVLLALSFLVARDQSLADALYQDFFANSPFAIAKTTVVGGLFWLLASAVLAGEAAARDVATGMHPLVYTAPLSKAEYLGGRFLAALVLHGLLLLAVQAGILLAVYSPGVDPKVIGPFRPEAFVTAYAYIALPNALAATAIQFGLAVRSGRAMTAYLGSVLLVFTGFFLATVLRYFVRWSLGTLLDPVGIQFVVEDLAHLWTTAEKSTRLLKLEGAFLENRLLWIAVALGSLALTHRRFRFAHRTETTRWWRRLGRRGARSPIDAGVASVACAAVIAPVFVPKVPRAFGFAMQARQTLAIAWASFRMLAMSRAGIALLIVVPLLAAFVVPFQLVAMGTPLVPTTMRVLMELTGGLTAELAAEPNRWVIVPLLIVFFAGELVWREREAGLGEIAGVLPGSDWAPFLGKLLGLSLVVTAFLAALMMAGMLAQVSIGYRDFEIGLYLKVLFGLQLPEYLLFAALALVVHVLIDQKYVAHFVAILAYAFLAVLAALLGIEHKLLVFGAAPAWSYTEMRGFGATLGAWLWFKLYWAAWALLLAVLGRLLWVRGRDQGLGVRLKLARRRMARPTAAVGGAATLLILTLGGSVFYNTNVLNRYLSSSDVKERSAEYERRYGQYETLPQPELVGTELRVEIYPERRAVEIRGSYQLVNAHATPIDSVHVATSTSVETRALAFDRAATLAVDDKEHGYRIYALDQPLEPGAALRLDFDVQVEPRGFGNHGASQSVAARGSSFTNQAWFPFVGYQRFRELMGPADRREHGLAPRPVLASLYEVEGREPPARGGGIAFDAVVGTVEDQVAVAPGALRRTWTERGRRYFHYSTDAGAPIGAEWSFFSADYAVHEGQWQDVAIRIFHGRKHTAHVGRMLQSVVASLDYYSEHFGAYPYRYLTVVEHPGAPGTGAHADPSMISHGEGFAYWIPRDSPSLDVPFFVIAHEMAHQWTLPYALVEGLPFLAEGIANYFAMQAVRATRGEEQFRRLMAFLREPYPFRPIRRGEPLLRALDPYMARRKGPFAMHVLGEYVGLDRVNHALRRLIEPNP